MAKYLAIKCKDCETILYKQDFMEERCFATCHCGKIKMGTMVIDDSVYDWYVTLQYDDERPEIYETDTKEINAQ